MEFHECPSELAEFSEFASSSSFLIKFQEDSHSKKVKIKPR